MEGGQGKFPNPTPTTTDNVPTGVELGSYAHMSTLSFCRLLSHNPMNTICVCVLKARVFFNFVHNHGSISYNGLSLNNQPEEQIARSENTSCKCGEVSQDLTTLHTQFPKDAQRPDLIHEKWRTDIRQLETASAALQNATAELRCGRS